MNSIFTLQCIQQDIKLTRIQEIKYRNMPQQRKEIEGKQPTHENT